MARGRLEGDRADQVLRLWADQGVLEGDEARERLGEAVCVLLDEAGEVVGVNSAHPEEIPLIAGRRFFVYSAVLPSQEDETASAMFNAAYEALNAEFQADRSGPLGMSVSIGPDEARRSPDAIWKDTELVHAGNVDGRQVRIRYFDDAAVAPGMPNSPKQADWAAADHSLPAGYRIVPISETDAVGPAEVLELWASENAVPEQEARRRVHQVLMVGLDPEDRLAGISTAYLQRNAQLGMDLWYYRTYVAQKHRMGNLSLGLIWASRDHLRDRFESGEDARAPGVLMEVENQFLKAYYNTGYWEISDFLFIGESELGAHVRVHYFPSAKAPAPG
jgi:hypothetical protein